jgi:hypothetical protein
MTIFYIIAGVGAGTIGFIILVIVVRKRKAV